MTLYTTNEDYVGTHDEVYMLIELVDWSRGSNITLSVPIPILIESCIPIDVDYASGEVALSAMVLITEIPSEVELDAPRFIPVPDCPYDLSKFKISLTATDGND